MKRDVNDVNIRWVFIVNLNREKLDTTYFSISY